MSEDLVFRDGFEEYMLLQYHFDGDASNTGSLGGYTMTVVDSAYGTVIGGLWTGTSCTLP